MYETAEKEINKGLSLFARGFLAVFACLFGAGMILMAQSSEKPAGVIAFGVFCILIAVACITRGRARQFVGSTIGVCLFGLAIAYVCSEAMSGPVDTGHRSEPSLRNSILFLLAIGVPGISYAIRAKFGLKKQSNKAN